MEFQFEICLREVVSNENCHSAGVKSSLLTSFIGIACSSEAPPAVAFLVFHAFVCYIESVRVNYGVSLGQCKTVKSCQNNSSKWTTEIFHKVSIYLLRKNIWLSCTLLLPTAFSKLDKTNLDHNLHVSVKKDLRLESTGRVSSKDDLSLISLSGKTFCSILNKVSHVSIFVFRNFFG